MKDFLGKGISFPLEYSKGQIRTADYEESVKSAIRYVLSTRKGERFMRPEFGTELYNLVFEGVTDTSVQLAEIFAQEALLTWVARLKSVTVNGVPFPDEHLIQLHIEYTTIDSPTPELMVYPFYLQVAE